MADSQPEASASNSTPQSTARDLWVGFDLGGTKMLAAVCDSKFEIIARRRKNTKGHEGADAGIDRVKQTLEKAIEEAGVTLDRIAGIGIGCPGPLDLEDGIVLQTPNLGWKNVPICELLEEHRGDRGYGLPDMDLTYHVHVVVDLLQSRWTEIGRASCRERV